MRFFQFSYNPATCRPLSLGFPPHPYFPGCPLYFTRSRPRFMRRLLSQSSVLSPPYFRHLQSDPFHILKTFPIDPHCPLGIPGGIFSVAVPILHSTIGIFVLFSPTPPCFDGLFPLPTCCPLIEIVLSPSPQNEIRDIIFPDPYFSSR